MTFSVDITKWVNKIEGQTKDAIRATEYQIFAQVIKKTPVDTGRAKGNWQLTKDTPASGTLKVDNTSPLKSLGSLGAALLNKITGNPQITFLSNNLDYINKLEDGGSGQAPSGMVKTTVAEFKKIAAQNGFIK